MSSGIKKRSSQTGAGNTSEPLFPDSPSSDFEPDESMLVVSDEGEMGDEARHTLSPTATIDESMILSDEEEDHRAYEYSKPSGKKIWTTSRTKKNHSNPGNAAASALMVEDKPWRTSAGPRNRAPAIDAPQPKSPGRKAQHIKPLSNLPPAPTIQSQSTPSDGKRPILKYIRGFGVTSPQSPRRVVKPEGSPPGWGSDNENDDEQSSISSDMISYSSMESMDDSDDDNMSLPLEDYTNHPEKQPRFWNDLPDVPSHFVHDLNAAELNSMVACTSNANSTGCLAYLDPDFRESTLRDTSTMNGVYFALDHRFYLRALMQLLAYRDEVGVEDSIHDDQNIIKKGPMRKKYLGKVKVKYLELRRGNLTYFGDNDGEGRRTVHLRSATASCNAVDDSSTDSDKDAIGTTTTSQSTNRANSSSVSSSHAAASLSAGLTSAVNATTSAAVNATTSAASTIAGGTSITAGFEFHLWVEGKRYAWLANSKNERQSWVRAIRQAMIGDDDDWGMTLNANNATNPVDVGATHEEAMEKYQRLQQSLSCATSTEEYLESLLTLVPRPEHPAAAPALQVPLKCVLDQMPKEKNEAKKDGTSQRRRVKSSIAEFWNNLQSFDFSINGCAIDKESPFAAERIVGSLVRCILDFDRCFVDVPNSDQPHLPSLTEGPGADRQPQKRSDANRISELNAVSYARNILSLIIKSKTSGDVEFAVENLLKNEKLVQVDHINPSSALSTSSETLHIDVSFAGDDVVDHDDDSPASNEVSGWVMVRRSKYNTWKTRFCVFSEGVFSYYENAKPRPHGLRGQLLLSGGTITKLDEKDRAREDSGLYILRLTTKGQERERQFGFKSKDEMVEWKAVIQHELDACGTTRLQSPGSETNTREDGIREPSTGKKAMSIIEGGSKLISYATDESLKAIKGATGSSIKVVKGGTKVIKDATGAFTKGATNLMFRSIRSSRSRSKRGEAGRSMIRTPSLQFLMESTRTAKTGKREPTVQCIIQTTTDFRVQSAAHNQNEAEEITLVTVRVKFLQAYLLSGGNGRLARGDATIELEFVDET